MAFKERVKNIGFLLAFYIALLQDDGKDAMRYSMLTLLSDQHNQTLSKSYLLGLARR